MLNQERTEDPAEALRLALLGWQSEIWTALPGILDSFNTKTDGTCVCQVTIRGKWRAKDGSISDVQLPQCLDVPLIFPGGGGFTLTFPMAAGDEGLIVFSSRCIDAWWQSGGIQNQAEIRMHSLSDGFFIPGIRSVPRALANISTTASELRSDDGTVKVAVKANEIDVIVGPNVSAAFTEDQITLTAHDSSILAKSGEIDITATTIKLNGLVWGTHEHTGVQVGAGKTGGPTAP